MMLQAAVVHSARRSSPAPSVLCWGSPPSPEDALADNAERRRRAAQLSDAYRRQIQERETLRKVFAASEAAWPFQPTHQPEAKLVYASKPRYEGMHYPGRSAPASSTTL